MESPIKTVSASFRSSGVYIFHADVSASRVLGKYLACERCYVFKVKASEFAIYGRHYSKVNRHPGRTF